MTSHTHPLHPPTLLPPSLCSRFTPPKSPLYFCTSHVPRRNARSEHKPPLFAAPPLHSHSLPSISPQKLPDEREKFELMLRDRFAPSARNDRYKNLIRLFRLFFRRLIAPYSPYIRTIPFARKLCKKVHGNCPISDLTDRFRAPTIPTPHNDTDSAMSPYGAISSSLLDSRLPDIAFGPLQMPKAQEPRALLAHSHNDAIQRQIPSRFL